jgi:hypothetical protein
MDTGEAGGLAGDKRMPPARPVSASLAQITVRNAPADPLPDTRARRRSTLSNS